MYWWFKWIVLLSLAMWIQYYRNSVSKLPRTRTKGSTHITSSNVNLTETYEFYNRAEQNKNGYSEFKLTVYSKGICGDLQIPPLKRPCTPFLHLHDDQTEKFTILQGQFSYRFGEKIYSCDSRTCPSPIIIPPLVHHTFWMHENKEDLILIIHIEPTSKDHGLRIESFENIVGVNRDKLMNLWQAFVFIDSIETYPVFLPLPFVKVLMKIGSLIGRLLGYQAEYDDYTTIDF
ncbi:unnamed protein product [Rotaria socialis]|uniref:Cupin 2 conserved barrel domain-containing protein n=1 Tax=Rotaria socialis TaxID=392032 RepID=A0A818C888_9BILA|nr:unnamed protein product [Rotaria socialis]CAF3424267.1 unnamed protein product [Rotaria socialis]CAF3435999.1 unnamed protein product [Rotaria socialis]CAF4163861.1 unnamed protein product [Rotaria socialis]CAF4316394.1 unnamed protein product [Rotaria socialis]